QAAAAPGERKVLAREGSPCEIGGRQIRQRQACDVAVLDVADAPVGLVSRNFFLVEVVGEQAAPRIPEPCARHAAAGEELDERVLAHARDRFSTRVPYHMTPSPLTRAPTFPVEGAPLEESHRGRPKPSLSICSCYVQKDCHCQLRKKGGGLN